MQSFRELTAVFDQHFSQSHFPEQPSRLYNAARYILNLGGKRVRPVSLLMANELFSDINPDAYKVATAVELFHNFTLIHDDIMDQAPLRRGLDTVHVKYGSSTALLSGDVMLVAAYDQINKIHSTYLHRIIALFNRTAREVCEGQQLDMEFEEKDDVSFDEYMHMITLKTSVLLAASLQMGAILGGASVGNQQHLYEFGKNLGIAFQVQDDYLDAFGDPDKFGKKQGGDILANKKTFLMIHAMKEAKNEDRQSLIDLAKENPTDKVKLVQEIFGRSGVEKWSASLKKTYFEKAMLHLEDVAVLSSRKKELADLAGWLIKRDS